MAPQMLKAEWVKYRRRPRRHLTTTKFGNCNNCGRSVDSTIDRIWVVWSARGPRPYDHRARQMPAGTPALLVPPVGQMFVIGRVTAYQFE